MPTVIKVENLSKYYRLGLIGGKTLHDDLNRWWARVRKQPDPLLKIGQEDRRNGNDEYIWALREVSFEVQQGEIVGIIGRNGAGKSTLLKILSRITAPTSGQVKVKGRIASLLEVGTGFHPELTGRENIYLNGAILGMKKAEIDRKFDEIVAFAEVEKFIDTPVKRYSSGMYVRLAFAVAAHLEPEILIVDEVLAVGDAAFQKKCLGKMGEVAKEGRTVLFVSHQMAAVENLCKICFLLERGIVVEIGKTRSIITHYLQNVFEPAIVGIDLANRTDRSGTGIVQLTDFHCEDNQGNRLTTLQSGMDVLFVFTYRCDLSQSSPLRNVDVGFSLHKATNDQTLSVLYSSYQDETFTLTSESGYVRCRILEFPLTVGRYRLGARITVNGIEADWPKDGIGFIDVVEGDFYGTGKKGFGESVPFLLKGEWSYTAWQKRSQE